MTLRIELDPKDAALAEPPRTLRRDLRPDLPILPARMRKLPLDARGYPVPWFVEWIDGVPDFRVMDSRKLIAVMKGERRCWTCGQPLGRNLAFVVGPMCAVNRISSEPPSHLECALFAVTACPFLSRPKAHRREANTPAGAGPGAGTMIERNPGVSLVWVTRHYRLVDTGQKVPIHWLFEMGEPTRVFCYAEGRDATLDEIRASVESGLPLLEAACDQEHTAEDRVAARKDLARQVTVARQLLHIGQ
jgi:hypothetical protein